MKKFKDSLLSIDEESDKEDNEHFDDDFMDNESVYTEILAETRRAYKTQDEFTYTIFDQICKYFTKDWSSTARKTVIPRNPFVSTQKFGNSRQRLSNNSSNQLYETAEKPPWALILPDESVDICFRNKNRYRGRLSRKMMEGNGVYQWQHGTGYKGTFEENNIRGKGYLEWKNDAWYEGEFYNGYRHGRGTMVYRDYHILYIGQWYMGQKHENGYCRYGEDNSYEGEWNMGRKHGVGLRIYPSGAKYIGLWKNDCRDGLGTMTWPNGDIYRGEWKAGAMHGHGQYTWNGFFNKTLSWPQEASYIGHWIDGKRDGKGLLQLNSVGGARFSGEWKNDLKDGDGIIIGNNGELTEGNPLFENNILVGSIPESQTYLLNEENVETAQNFEDKELNVTEFEPLPKIYRTPRTTTAMKPEQWPSIWFHLYQLLDPTGMESRSDTSIISGKCYDCNNTSCTCLRTSSSTKVSSTHAASPILVINSSTHKTAGNESIDNAVVNDSIPKIETKSDILDLSDYYFEGIWVYNCFTQYVTQLRVIYKRYSEIFCDNTSKSSLSMTRLCLWQFWRDCGIHNKGMSLVEIDEHLALNKSILIHETYYPFERIEFWQFLHALLEVSWHLYTKPGNIESRNTQGRVASGFKKFLKNDILPNMEKPGTLSNINKDLLPLFSVYQLYQDVGEPHTAQDLLCVTCIMKGLPDPKPYPLWSSLSDDLTPEQFLDGFNAITIGERISYIPKKQPFNKPTMITNQPKEATDKLSNTLYAFRKLGAKKMTQILADVCPAIKDKDTGMIINMEYKITFLEFYEIIIQAAMAVLREKKKAAERAAAAAIAAEMRLQEPEEAVHSFVQIYSSKRVKTKKKS
ncbi:uncharacterized protein LOC107270912 isoform X3 [Cephus cinctus]|uniref:Uncharacterized protein LOC107270912 isoform X3 n=1 Tax=Cephus cinctus TaxID=211228 RepID=A0AAJ7RN34_CEPCN|nr:uncharacterized protein LOC107270912 isoform X3 [Cephus cinctus]